jgi:glycogen debranching enzyme
MVNTKLVVALLALAAAAPAAAQGSHRPVVRYALFTDQQTREDSAAIAWLSGQTGLAVDVARLAGDGATVPACDILWIHLPDSASYREYTLREQKHHAIAAFAGTRGALLCTGYGAFIAHDLGFEPVRPTVRYDTLVDDWLWDKKGFQSFRGHPLLAGLFGGDYVWDARVDQILPIIGYYGAAWPERSSVIAVEKSYVFLHADRKIVAECRRDDMRILSIGGLVYFAQENNLRRNMERFVGNALLYLAGSNKTGPVTVWRYSDGIARTFALRSAPLRTSPKRILHGLPSSGLLLSRDHPRNDFFDLAGRRALIMGRENGGIDEVWLHPIRIMRDYEVGVITGDSVSWLANRPVSVQIRPESFTRKYTLPGGTLTEIIFAAFERSGGVAHYESSFPLRLIIRFRSDLRWMWPYDAGALGNLLYALDDGLDALHIRDSSGTFACSFGADVPPASRVAGQYAAVRWDGQSLAGTPTAENQIAFGALYDLGTDNSNALNFAFAGTNEGSGVALADYRFLLEHPETAYAEMVNHYTTLLARSVTITSPDSEFNKLFPWAIVGTDRFIARTPGLGTGLLAGFSTVNRGWNGAQKISGRPGYAWYFGRDAAWSGFAVDGYGDFATVRDQLELYQSFQDASGKIYHELSTSGVVHFDAADATPLYVILAGHYLRASGDKAFIAKSWPHLQRAMDFLYATDTDHDGLIENTDVGHGWVEPGGTLFGAHSEFYLSVLWSQALHSAASMADMLGDHARAARYLDDAGRVERILNSDFWNTGTQYFNFGKLQNGTFNPERTVFPAVGMLYGVLDDAKVKLVTPVLAGNGFTTNWGVRILTSASPHFNPRSYQEGSVWPLMTGWTALGEYTYGNSAQAFSHLMDVLLIKNLWSLGYVQEVMHGAVNRPGGVCPHQCWSETNILHPAIEGMIGWKPDALQGSASLTPRFPLSWDSVTVSNLRVGATALRVTMIRTTRTTTFRIRRLEGPGCKILLAPEIPPSMDVTKVTVNGSPVPISHTTTRGLMTSPVPVNVETESLVLMEHTGGIGVLPLVMHPAPGDSAAGVRLLATEYRDGLFSMFVEGTQGESTLVPLALFDHVLPSIQGGRIRRGEKPGTAVVVVEFPPSTTPLQQAVIRLQLR